MDSECATLIAIRIIISPHSFCFSLTYLKLSMLLIDYGAKSK